MTDFNIQHMELIYFNLIQELIYIEYEERI